MPFSTLMNRLRTTTAEAHAALERLPYFQALKEKTLPLESYVGHLRGLAVLHAVLEHELARTSDGRLQQVWADGMRRFPQLQADLVHFAAQGVLDIPAGLEAARGLAQGILRKAADRPIALLGHLYVLEGSINGAAVLGPLVGGAFGLDPGHGLRYLTWDAEAARARWQGFMQRMDAVPLEVGEREEVLTTATEAFNGLQQMLAALFPFASDRLAREVASLNPEAGAHAMTQDPAEIEAALRAGVRCRQAFPYFAWRFGERGWRYTQSDGAWLVTLAGLDQGVVDAQVQWLAGLLAARGMPSLLLQRHLELLYEELRGQVAAPPGSEYGRLLRAADLLAEQRRTLILDAELDLLTQAFEGAIGLDWRHRLPGTAPMLVSAVTDRARGLRGAVDSLEPWMTDPVRFPAPWIAAVHDLLRKAELLARRQALA